ALDATQEHPESQLMTAPVSQQSRTQQWSRNPDANKILDALTAIENKVNTQLKKFEPLEALMKTLEEPARQAGVSPAALIARAVADGNHATFVGGDGSISVASKDALYSMKTVQGRMREKNLRLEIGNNEEATFGDYLSNMYTWLVDTCPAERKNQAQERLHRM